MADSKKILFICGSLNQTTMMHKISKELDSEFDCYFSPYFADKFLNKCSDLGLLNFSILGGNFKKQTEKYLSEKNLKTDFRATNNNYDLVFTCSDLIVPKNIRDKKIILVQEGMTDPENLVYHIVKRFKLPRWIASTSTTSISNLYDLFCVASEGYRDLFIKKGADPKKIVVTGIPNFDNAEQYIENDIPHKNFVLVATTDSRETFKYENRKKFINKTIKIADGRQLIFKLHPNENYERAKEEINKYAPGSLVYIDMDINYLIANCDTLITRHSSCVYIGMVLGKEVYTEFDINELKNMVPIQNGGASADKIASIAKAVIDVDKSDLTELITIMNKKLEPVDTHE